MSRRLMYLPLALLLLLGGTVEAQGPNNLAGVINHITANLDGSGPWYITGDWEVKVKGKSGRADVAIALSMVRQLNEAVRQPHTHHIGLQNGEVTTFANGIRITGTPDATTNGSAFAPFAGSTIQVDITGGDSVRYSNIAVTFTGGAAGHFGSAPIQGVVTTE